MGALITAKENFHAVSLSGGKDSTCLLLLMIERGLPIDAVIWADTGMEFPEMYGHISKVDEHLYRERGLHITTLRSPKSFEYMMFDEPKQKPSTLENRARLGVPPYGNGLAGHQGSLVHRPAQDPPDQQGVDPSQGPAPPSGSMWVSRRTRPIAARISTILWWTGASPRPRPYNCAMTGALTSAACTGSTTAPPAGAAPFSGLGSCEIYAIITRSCGRAAGFG